MALCVGHVERRVGRRLAVADLEFAQDIGHPPPVRREGDVVHLAGVDAGAVGTALGRDDVVGAAVPLPLVADDEGAVGEPGFDAAGGLAAHVADAGGRGDADAARPHLLSAFRRTTGRIEAEGQRLPVRRPDGAVDDAPPGDGMHGPYGPPRQVQDGQAGRITRRIGHGQAAAVRRQRPGTQVGHAGKERRPGAGAEVLTDQAPGIEGIGRIGRPLRRDHRRRGWRHRRGTGTAGDQGGRERRKSNERETTIGHERAVDAKEKRAARYGIIP